MSEKVWAKFRNLGRKEGRKEGRKDRDPGGNITWKPMAERGEPILGVKG